MSKEPTSRLLVYLSEQSARRAAHSSLVVPCKGCGKPTGHDPGECGKCYVDRMARIAALTTPAVTAQTPTQAVVSASDAGKS